MKIRDYLPQKDHRKMRMTSVKVEEQLFKKVQTKLKKEKVKLQDLVDAAFKAYLNE